MDKNNKPVRDTFLVFGKPYIGEEEIKEVERTLRSGWWGTGPKTELFENNFKKYEGVKYAISVNSATAGLHLSLKVLGVGPGDEVITTPLTFVSTANVIVHCGAKPVFADIDRETWNIDPKEIEKKITKRTKAILPVHLHGRPCNMDSILKIAKDNNLNVVSDAAHAVEAEYKGKKVGSIGDLVVFSFYVTKNVATGEGGMITTNNKKFFKELPIWRLHGLSRDAWKRYSVKHFNLYEALVPGFKYNLTDIASSIGIHQLARVEKNLKVRRRIWDMYTKAFLDEPLLTLPAPVEKNTRHGMHLYAILLKLGDMKVARNEFVDMLIKENIGSGVHFAPIHTQPFYKKEYVYKKGQFPNAEYVGERILSLPLGANLTKKDVEDVITAVKKVLKAVSK
ncbi:MAG: DegT/DnrJ/EryC1/StrS family aminotransferase [bacterium]